MRTVETQSMGGFYRPDVSPCTKGNILETPVRLEEPLDLSPPDGKGQVAHEEAAASLHVGVEDLPPIQEVLVRLLLARAGQGLPGLVNLNVPRLGRRPDEVHDLHVVAESAN